jgi:hypothetical protein
LAYAAEIDRLRAKTLAGFQKILEWMLKRRLIPPEDAMLKPHIVVVVEDQRLNKARDLPPTAPWE